MKKHLLFSAAAVVAVAGVASLVSAADYDCSSLGTTSRSDRYVSSLTLSDDQGSESVTISDIQTAGTRAIYVDKSEQTFTTKPGATVTITPSGAGSWIHSYAYIDWDGDGFSYTTPADFMEIDESADAADQYKLKAGVDLVAFTRWCPSSNEKYWYDTNGYVGQNTGQNIHNWDIATAFSFTIPADAKPGTYRMRYKSAWNQLDPNGVPDIQLSNTLVSDGGCIADFTLVIAGETEPEQPGEVNYDLSSLGQQDGNNGYDRWMSSATLSAKGSVNVKVSPIRERGVEGFSDIYRDLSDIVFTVEAGKAVTMTVEGGTWDSYLMSTYLYIDWGKDGFKYTQPSDLVNVENSVPLPGSDLVVHNGWSKDGYNGTCYNSDGEQVSAGAKPPYDLHFVIPEGTEPGLYRARVKAARNSINPNGADEGDYPLVYGASIADFTIEVVEPVPLVPIDPATLVDFTNPVGTDAEWTVTTCCHADNGEGANGRTEQLTDGDKTNFWHIAYDGNDAAMCHTGHHYFTFDLKKTRSIGGFNWTSRTQAPSATALNHGLLRGWELYVAENADELAFADNAAMEAYRASHEAAASGTCDVQFDNNEFSVTFYELVKGRYFLFVATEVGEKGDWIKNNYEYLHCCEFSFLATPVKEGEASPVLVYNFFDNDDQKWTVESFCCDEPNNEGSNGTAVKMIDNDPNSFYHSNWGQFEYKDGSHFFVIDLKESQDIFGIAYTPRQAAQTNGLWRSVKVFASDNKNDFGFRNQIDGYTVYKHQEVTALVDAYVTEHAAEGRDLSFTVGANGSAESVMFDTPLNGRYVLVVVTETYSGHNVVGELGFYLDGNVYGDILKEPLLKAKIEQLTPYKSGNIPGAEEIVDNAVEQLNALELADFETNANAIIANTRASLQGILDGLATSGKAITIRNIRRANMDQAAYLACVADSINTVAEIEGNLYASWTVAVSGENFVLRNVGRNVYACLADGNKYFTLSENAEDAALAPFRFTLKDNGTIALTMANATTYNMDTRGNGLTWYTSPDAGEEWGIAYDENAPIETTLVYNSLANDLKWTIADFCCDEPSNESPYGKIEYMIDNNFESYYHSNWGDYEYKGEGAIHHFVVDIKTSQDLYGIAYVPRVDQWHNGVWREVSVFATDDEEAFNFTAQIPDYVVSETNHQAVSALVSDYATEHAAEGRDCTFASAGTSAEPESVMFDKPLHGRYVLVVVKSSTTGHNVGAELGFYYSKAAYEELLNSQNEKQEKLEVIEKKIADVIALSETYLESVPFTAGLEDFIATLKTYPLEMYLEYYDELDEFIATALVAPVEETVLQALNDNVADKVWTLYQPGQNGYLCATTKATNKGYDSFNYQGAANENSQWTLVAGETEGQFYLRSSKGQYIGTPAQNYCRVEDTVENAGLFTLGVKEGYVTFNSVAFEGCGLGLDGKNDPAEIMTLEDGSLGYRWQVTVADKPEPVEPVAVDMVVTPEAGLQESIGSIQFYIADAEYSINTEVTEPVTLTKGTATLHSLDNAELAKHYSEKGQMYYLDVNLTENGTYTLTIPEAKFKGETVYNNKTVVTWTINNNGITSVTVNGEEVEAYDLQGRRVQKVGKGLYIVNGVKTLVK